MEKKVLVTGANGFIGYHLCRRLEEKSIPYEAFVGNITDFQNVYSQLYQKNYTTIFHLAGLSNISDCEVDPSKAFSINVTGTFNLLESIRKMGTKIRFIFPSTSHVYAPITELASKVKISEEFPVKPSNVYSITKLQAESLISHYFKNHSLGQAVVFRLFNHTHHSQKGPFFFPQLLSQLKQEPLVREIKMGNINIYRDFGLVQDLINIFEHSMNATTFDDFDIFNLCSGQPRLLKDLIYELVNFMKKDVKIIEDENKVRKNEPLHVVGDNYKILSKLNESIPERSNIEFIEKFMK
jgi:GDP-4-dehydro-6-deoxy-D-mannose reductase